MDRQLVQHHCVDDIHIFEFDCNSKVAFEQYLTLMAPIYYAACESDPKKPFCYVLDVSESGMFSITYMMARLSVVLRKSDVWLTQYVAYITGSYHDEEMVYLMNQINAHRSGNMRKVFQRAAFDEALAWLKAVLAAYERDRSA